MTILFLDLETTGLDPKRDRILEVAAIVTDDGLTPYGDFESVVKYDPETAPPVDARVVAMHTRNELWPCCLHERATPIDAVDALLAERVLRWSPLGPGTALLSGNSVHFDRSFMVEHMPKTLSLLHYRQIDVSSFNEVAKRFWLPTYNARPAPQKGHRAMQDVLESLATLRHYVHGLAAR